MGPLSYMRSVVDRNVVMWRITGLKQRSLERAVGISTMCGLKNQASIFQLRREVRNFSLGQSVRTSSKEHPVFIFIVLFRNFTCCKYVACIPNFKIFVYHCNIYSAFSSINLFLYLR